MHQAEIKKAQIKSIRMLEKAHVVLTAAEKKQVEVCDYNLGQLSVIGTQIVIYANTKRCCAKEIILFPYQICPEHIHPQLQNYPGKEETFRCRWGEVYLYVPGTPARKPKARIPAERRAHFRVWREIILKPGQQYTLLEKTLHWFQAGPQGAVVSEFSTQSYDDKDIFTDPEITRLTNLKRLSK